MQKLEKLLENGASVNIQLLKTSKGLNYPVSNLKNMVNKADSNQHAEFTVRGSHLLDSETIEDFKTKKNIRLE